MMTKTIAATLLFLLISGGASSAWAQKRKSIVDLIVRGGHRGDDGRLAAG